MHYVNYAAFFNTAFASRNLKKLASFSLSMFEQIFSNTLIHPHWNKHTLLYSDITNLFLHLTLPPIEHEKNTIRLSDCHEQSYVGFFFFFTIPEYTIYPIYMYNVWQLRIVAAVKVLADQILGSYFRYGLSIRRRCRLRRLSPDETTRYNKQLLFPPKNTRWQISRLLSSLFSSPS